MEKMSSRTAQLREDWRVKLLVFLKGNRTPYGVLVIAILGRAASNPPRLVGYGSIDENGQLWSLGQERGDDPKGDFKIIELGPISTIVESLRRIADKAKLTDAQRIELFSEFRKWVTTDNRTEKSFLG